MGHRAPSARGERREEPSPDVCSVLRVRGVLGGQVTLLDRALPESSRTSVAATGSAHGENATPNAIPTRIQPPKTGCRARA